MKKKSLYNPFLVEIAKQCIEQAEKNSKIFLKRLSHTCPAHSLGSLLFDYICGGGIFPRMITFAGKAGSGKSLSSNSIIVDACKDGIPVFYFDAEGNIGVNDLEELFEGDLNTLMDEHIFNFYQDKNSRIIEKVISTKENNIKLFPNKEYVDEKESWYYTFIHDGRTEEGKKDQQLLSKLLRIDKSYKIDKELSNSDSYGRGVIDYFQVPDSKNKSGIQAVFVIDSLAALIPEKMKDDQDAGGLLQEPRLLAQYLKRICPYLERKCIMLICTNQGYCEMPTNPYSQLKYIEKGGIGPQHYHSIGFILTDRAASTAKGEKEEQNPLGDRIDQYTYKEVKCVRNRINKTTPDKVFYRRIWRTSNRELMGLDPFWDTIKYLEITNQ